MRAKAEKRFLGDYLLFGSPLTKGRDFKEVRRFQEDDLHVEFHFVTKCLNDDVQKMMRRFREDKDRVPDILVMNSTHWDVTRWGPSGVQKFKENMQNLTRLLKSSLPPSTLVVWVTAPPSAVEIRGGYMIKQLEFAQFTLRFHVMEANLFARQLMSQFGFNCLDFHFYLQWQVHWRRPDGIHWSSKSMRFLSNLLLTHISLALGVPLPGNWQSNMLSKHKAVVAEQAAAVAAQDAARAVRLPEVPRVLMTTPSLPSPPRVSNPRSRTARAVRPSRQHHHHHHHQQRDDEAYHRRRQNRWDQTAWGNSNNPQHSMGPPRGPPMGPPMGHHMGHHMGPPMGHHMGHPMGPQMFMGFNGFGHGGMQPPLPAYQPPPLPPLPPGPEPLYTDFSKDDFDDEPQQIQSLCGPVRRYPSSHPGDRRHRPY